MVVASSALALGSIAATSASTPADADDAMGFSTWIEDRGLELESPKFISDSSPLLGGAELCAEGKSFLLCILVISAARA